MSDQATLFPLAVPSYPSSYSDLQHLLLVKYTPLVEQPVSFLLLVWNNLTLHKHEKWE